MMVIFAIYANDKKSYTVYTDDNGKFYEQNMTWWERGGYCIPQIRKKITKKRYMMMHEQAKEVKIML